MEKTAYDGDWLQYWIYDCYIPDMSAQNRYKFLINELNDKHGIMVYNATDLDDCEDVVRILEQIPVKTWSKMEKLHNQYVAEGFEGLVIRDPSKPYKPGGRTNDMIKIKHYQSSEFLVTGYELGLRGSEDMTFICETEDGIIFKASPMGDRALKEEYVTNFESKYKNKLGECTYFNLSDSGVPTQPKFKVFRWDLQ